MPQIDSFYTFDVRDDAIVAFAANEREFHNRRYKNHNFNNSDGKRTIRLLRERVSAAADHFVRQQTSVVYRVQTE